MNYRVVYCFGLVCSFFGGNLSRAESNASSFNESSWKHEIITTNFETLSTCVKDVLKLRLSVDNVEFSPCGILVVTAMMLIKTLYYIDITSVEASSAYRSLPAEKKSEHLEQARSISKLIESMQNGSENTLQVNTAVFLPKLPTPQMRAYSEYMKKLFNSDIMEAEFDCSRQYELMQLTKSWQLKKGKGYPRMWNDYLTPSYGVTYTQACFVTFTGCWHSSKIFEKSIQYGNFISNDYITQTTTLAAKAFIGYSRFADLKVEAARLPYRDDKFAMLILLPYRNESLNLFDSFTETEYQMIFQRVSNTFEFVDLKIPCLNVANIIVNENGTAINTSEKISCQSPLLEQLPKANNTDYKVFHVDRPFAMIVYHEEMKSAFYCMLVNNTISKISKQDSPL